MDSEVVIEEEVVDQEKIVEQARQEAEKPEEKGDEKNQTSNKDINNQIEDIISDIDLNIKAQEKITQLKEQELQLIQKQKDLANQIQQQQLLAQQLMAENQRKEQELKAQELQAQQLKLQQQSQNESRIETAPKITQDYTKSYNRQVETQQESSSSSSSANITRTVDLRKIFTPATDAPQIVPKNRKLYASSAFYSPTLHPTVEDQVELARRISHSLSDISNQTSKGQSMYVNRKKRSVKWVHEASGQEEEEEELIETQAVYKENAEEFSKAEQATSKLDKMPLKLVMNPRGQMRDYNSLKESINVETGLLSPDNCAELITALQLQKGRGAELFAKRRRKAENWVVDETNAGSYSPSGIPDYQQYQQQQQLAKPPSPNLLPAYSDAGKHRVQLNLHQDQLIEKYSKPGVQVVKSPWEAALQTGSASTAFMEDSKFKRDLGTPSASSLASPIHFRNQDVIDYAIPSPASVPAPAPAPAPAPLPDTYKNAPYEARVQGQASNPQRELAYKPSVAQGWGGRNVELPKGLYVPKEISLASYAPPPVQSSHNFHSPPKADYSKTYQSAYAGAGAEAPLGAFPVSNSSSGLYSSVPPKQQLNAPLSYQKVPPSSMQAAGPQVNFNPSPLSFEKLSKFQEQPDQRSSLVSSPRYLNVNKQTGVRNASPTPFGSVGGSGLSGGFEMQRPTSNSFNKPSSPQFGGFGQGSVGAGSYPSYNNCARGWSQGSQVLQGFNNPRAPVATESLPYSDF